MAATFDPHNNLGFDLSSYVASGATTYSLVVKGTDPKTSGKYYVEFTISDVGGGTTLYTSASTSSGATLPFFTTTGVADTAPVKGTNIAGGSQVLSFNPNIDVTLTENIFGTIGASEPITFGTAGCLAFPTPSPGFGIAMLGADFNALAANARHGAILNVDGNVEIDGVVTTVITAPLTTSDVVCMALDIDDMSLWFRKNSGYWNNNMSADPGGNIGGLDISSLFGNMVFAVVNNACNAAFSVTVATDPSSFVFTPPSGFIEGWQENSYVNLGITKFTAQASVSPPNLAMRKFTGQAPLSPPNEAVRKLTAELPLGPPNEAVRKLTAELPLGPPNLAARKLTGELTLGPPNLAIRKFTAYAIIQPVPPLPPFGPIPIFPALPEGFPIRLSIVMDTTVGTTKSLREVRVANQQLPLWDIEIPFQELRDQTQNQVPYEPFTYPVVYQQYEELCQLWLMMYGQTNVFAYDAHWDDSRSDQFIAKGDGITYVFTIIRTWGYGLTATSAPIGVINTVFDVEVNGVTVSPLHYYTDRNKIYFVDGLGNTYPPGNGLDITMTFSYYYLCRFTEDEQDFEEFAKNRWTVPSLKFRAVIWP